MDKLIALLREAAFLIADSRNPSQAEEINAWLARYTALEQEHGWRPWMEEEAPNE